MKHVDTRGFDLKLKHVRRAYAQAAQKSILVNSQILRADIDKNLKGPGIHPRVKGSEDSRINKMPIPRRTGALARSFTMTLVSSLTVMFWMNPVIAKHYKIVHKNRKYMFDSVRKLRRSLLSSINKDISNAISKAGTKR